MTADEVMLKKKEDKQNPLYPDAHGEVKPLDRLRKKSSVKPFVKFDDLNNGPDTGYDNKPKSAVVVGIKIEF